jgi:hypothetical protein
MAIEINWQVSEMNCLPQTQEGTNYVICCHWQCNGVDGDYNGSVYSTCSFPVVEGTSFTPYADLTQAQVLGWIWANGVDKDATEAAVEGQIEAQKNPPVVSPPLPWVSP